MVYFVRRSPLHLFYLGFALAAWLWGPMLAAAAAPSTQKMRLPQVAVQVVTPTQAPTFCLQLARTPAQWAQGLMHVKALPANGGMLFVFERAERRAFWMKDTFVPLDLLFVDADCRVVGVVQDAVPFDETELEVAAASRYVIELNAGTARRYGIAAGASVRFATRGQGCPAKTKPCVG